jgi:hypothetical protein
MDTEPMSIEEIVTRIRNTSFVEHDDLEGMPLYAAWIACQLARLAAALGESVSAERIALTAERLMGVEPLNLEWASGRARRECATFPKAVEIFDFLREIPGFGAEQ